MKNNRNLYHVPTKKDHLATINGALAKFYGCNTKVTNKVERLPIERLAYLAEIVYLWRNDPASEMINTLEENIRASF